MMSKFISTLNRREKIEINIINMFKDRIAKRHGYQENILGSSWEYAMMLTHRKKKQKELYEEVLIEITKLLIEINNE